MSRKKNFVCHLRRCKSYEFSSKVFLFVGHRFGVITCCNFLMMEKHVKNRSANDLSELNATYYILHSLVIN